MLKPLNTDQYIAGQPPEVQKMLEQIRAIVKKIAPQAKEVISYNMPAFKWHGMLIWYAAHTNHIGLYPRASAIEAFKKELMPYKSAKGSVQFPFNKRLPTGLITKIIQYRVAENQQRKK